MNEDNSNPGSGTPEDMGDSGEGQSSKRSPDSVAAEMNRKFDKIQQENQRLSQQIEALTQSIVSSRSQSATGNQPQEENLDDLAFKDPSAYARKVTERVTNTALNAVSNTINQQNRSNQILGQLVSDYPELNDINSELATKSVAIYKQMSEQERSNPLAYKAAVRDAAADLGVLPKSKRSTAQDGEFQFSASNPTGQKPPSQSRRKESELDNRTTAFAKLIGLNTDDKKVQERLKSRQTRKHWNKYE